MMLRPPAILLALLTLGGCVRPDAGVPLASASVAPIEIQILALNDFHGNLEPPELAIDTVLADGTMVSVPAGGVAYLASAAKALRAGQRHSVTVSAGDMIGGSPFVSALFLDEPTIAAMDMVGVEYNAVGNHEFDKGSAELWRMQNGGCARNTTKVPCAVEQFEGAKFKFLAANVIRSDGTTLFPGTSIKNFGPVQVGIIGMTLKDTATLVTPAGVAGLHFNDEASTANASAKALKLAGADAIMLLIHEGARTTGGYNDKSCPGLSGDILPIIGKLVPEIDLVVSGHSHSAYVCQLPRTGGGWPLLLTSAGRYGTLISDIRLSFAPDGTLQAKRADNIIVQGEGYVTTAVQMPVVAGIPRFAPDAAVNALVARYVAAAAPAAARVVGRLAGPITREFTAEREQTAGKLIADAQLAATRGNGAQIALINSGGVRTDLVPAADGSITYGQIFGMQPFGNNLVLKTLTGTQLKALLEQQFDSGSNTAEKPNMLLPSQGFFFAYDLSRPASDRIVEMRLGGSPIQPTQLYRVTVNNFMASGGDNFTVLTHGAAATDAGLELDALEAWLRRGAVVPGERRVENRTTR